MIQSRLRIIPAAMLTAFIAYILRYSVPSVMHNSVT
jgi:hypothetical protein